MEHLEKSEHLSAQNEFHRNRSCLHHIYALNTIFQTKARSQKDSLFAVFVDFKKAFNNTDRQLMYHTLAEKDVDRPLLDVIRQMYTQATNILWINDVYTTEFPSKIGVKQGDNFSPTCFS